MGGVLKSWAVPKGPSLNPEHKRLAVAVPDHSIEYGSFEGTLEGTYGAGEVRIWDEGEYEPEGDPLEQYRKGKISFEFFGAKLRGGFALVRMHGRPENWMLIKARDKHADPDWDLETVLPPKEKKRKRPAPRKSARP